MELAVTSPTASRVRRGRSHIAALALLLALAFAGAIALASLAATDADAKTPGKQYCFHGTCHRVASIAETKAMVGKEMTLNASFYDDCRRDRFNPCGLTSSGEAFSPDRPDNAASPIFPDGTTLLVFNPRTKGAAVVRVNNAGPYWGKRKIDLSKSTAEKLGFRKHGVADLQVRVIKAPTKAEATYKKNRRYARVPGFIGQHASLPDAHRVMASVMALEAIASSMLAPLSGGFVAAARDEARSLGLPTSAAPKRALSGETEKNRHAKGKQRGKTASAGDVQPASIARASMVAALGGGSGARTGVQLTPLG